MKKIALPLVVLLAAAAVAVWFVRRSANPEREPVPKTPAPAVAVEARDASPAASGATNATARPIAPRDRRQASLRARRVPRAISIEERTDITAEDKKNLLAIERALDADSLEDLLKALPEAASSTNTEVRSDLVDALGWFGKESLLDLLPFMADADEEVAQSAKDHWTMALNDVSSEKTKCGLVEKAMTILTDEDALESMVLEISDCDDLLVLQTLINVIEATKVNPTASRVAREHYEFTTSEKYTSFEDAEAWLAENYTSDSDDDDDDGASVATTRRTTRRKSSRRGSSGGSSGADAEASGEATDVSEAEVADNGAEAEGESDDGAEGEGDADGSGADADGSGVDTDGTEDGVEGESGMELEEDEEAAAAAAARAAAPAL